MLAYKVLHDGRSAFTGWEWPVPDGDSPGEWIEINGPIALCENGVHACTARQLPPWIGNELWAVELDGEILQTPLVLVASRARLLAPVRGWQQDTRIRYGEACESRASSVVAQRPDLQPLLGRIQRATSFASAGAAGYWAAMLAGDSVADRRSGPEYERGFAAERGAQADWLQAKLSLGG
jgi:hypothetical protein